MLELVRKYVEALAGVAELPRERAEKLVRELQKRGELRAKDLQAAAQEIVERSRRNRGELVRLVRKEIRHQVSQLGLARRDEVRKVADRVKDLERTPKAAAKKSAPRKPVRKPVAAKKAAPAGKAKVAKKPAAKKAAAKPSTKR